MVPNRAEGLIHPSGVLSINLMSKRCMAGALDELVKAINVVTLYANCLSDRFSGLSQLFLIIFKTGATFHQNK